MEIRRFLATLAACVLGSSVAHSSGVAVFKEQVYHRDSSAVAAAYTRMISSNGPHVRLVIDGRNFDVPRSKLVACVDVPDSIPASIRNEGDIRGLRGDLAAMKEFAARYPRSSPLLERNIEIIASHIACFEIGQVRFEGAWMSRDELARIIGIRQREERARELAEVERRVFEASQRDKGLVLHDGRWMTRREREQYPPQSLVELSECVAPLGSGDLNGARFAVANLTQLAAHQTGAPKVRTQRLAAAVRNLYLAEFRVTRQLMANSRDEMRAAALDRRTREWLKPNAFGTVRTDAARESHAQAMDIRQRASDALALRRRELLEQLRETGIVVEDFEKLREVRVAGILGSALRAVASRNFSSDELNPSFSDESMAAVNHPSPGGQSAPAL